MIKTRTEGFLFLAGFIACIPIANGLIALEGFVSRRVFVFVPRDGTPRARLMPLVMPALSRASVDRHGLQDRP